MLSLISVQNPPRRFRARPSPAQTSCKYPASLCTTPKSLTHAPTITKVKQVSVICYKTDMVKNPLPGLHISEVPAVPAPLASQRPTLNAQHPTSNVSNSLPPLPRPIHLHNQIPILVRHRLHPAMVVPIDPLRDRERHHAGFLVLGADAQHLLFFIPGADAMVNGAPVAGESGRRVGPVNGAAVGPDLRVEGDDPHEFLGRLPLAVHPLALCVTSSVSWSLN